MITDDVSFTAAKSPMNQLQINMDHGQMHLVLYCSKATPTSRCVACKAIPSGDVILPETSNDESVL